MPSPIRFTALAAFVAMLAFAAFPTEGTNDPDFPPTPTFMTGSST